MYAGMGLTMSESKTNYREVAEVEFKHVSRQLTELKERVNHLEVTVARGVMLLVANLVGVVISLAQQVMRG